MMKDRTPGAETIDQWILRLYGKDAKLAADGRTMSIAFASHLEKTFKDIDWSLDLVTKAWQDRPKDAMNLVFEHELEYTGLSRQAKLTKYREALKTIADASLLSSLDDIAWLLNIRGGDIAFNPVVYSFLYLTKKEAHLFIEEEKLSSDIRALLEADGIEIHAYEKVYDYMQHLTSDSVKRVHLDPSYANIRLKEAVSDSIELVISAAPSVKMKAVKNETEIENLWQTAITEGLALTRLSKWIKEEALNLNASEFEISQKMSELRREGALYVDDSFPAIVGYNENAAMMHYIPTLESSSRVTGPGVVLVDTGGHYLGGTTDVTRTYIIGDAPEEMRRDFTYVLKGNINLSRAVFMKGTSGNHLDILARQPLWEEGLDYKCGTGHGVGYLLSVHEGPQSFSMGSSVVPLEPGMIITNEPGVYKEGEYGIRLENMLLVDHYRQTEIDTFYHFKPISYCPIDLDGVVAELLEDVERTWLNEYHKTVYEKLSPYLNEEEKTWLAHHTRAI